MRILKTVKEYGSITISTSSQTLETQTIKALGDVVSWQLQTSLTTTVTGATELPDAGTPSGLFKGATVARLFKKIAITDVNNNDLCVLEKDDLWRQAYFTSLVDANDFLFDRGIDVEPTTITAAQTAQVDNFIIPQSIAVSDLPASIEIEIGVLTDFYSVVGTGTAVLNQTSLTVRYVPPKPTSITLRIKAFNVTAFSADTDISHLLPDGIKIHILAYAPANVNAASNPSESINTRVDRITLRRGSNEEIENQRRSMIDAFVDERYANARPTGLTVIPLDSFEKSDSTKFFFDVNAQIAPRIYYIYQ